MNREEIIKLIWTRMQSHTDEMEEANRYDFNVNAEKSFLKSFECKAILNLICTPAELRKLQEGGKL